MSRKIRLDKIDYSILEIAQKDATITNKELSKRIGLSQPATLVRVKHLIKKGYIVGSGFDLNWKKLNFNFRVLIVSNIDPSDQLVFLDAIRKCPQIIKTFLITPEHGLISMNDIYRYVSVAVFKDQEEFVNTWTLLTSKTDESIKFHLWELDKEYTSLDAIPIGQ